MTKSPFCPYETIALYINNGIWIPCKLFRNKSACTNYIFDKLKWFTKTNLYDPNQPIRKFSMVKSLASNQKLSVRFRSEVF